MIAGLPLAAWAGRRRRRAPPRGIALRVDDSVPNRVGRTQFAHRGRNLFLVDPRAGTRQLSGAIELGLVEDAQLEVAGTGVHDQNAHS